MKNTSQRGISPRNSAAKFMEHGEKYIPVISIKIIYQCFAVFRSEKDDSHKRLFIFYFVAINFNLDVFISFQVVLIFCVCFNFV